MLGYMEDSYRQRGDDRTRQAFEVIRALGEGKPAIFMESPTAHYVRVHGLTTSDWGVELTITCIPAPGFALLGQAKRESCEIGSAWQAWDAEPTVWMAQQISWRLLFDPVLVEAIVAEAAELQREGKQMDYQEALFCSHTHEAKLEAEKKSEDPREGTEA